VLKGTSIAQYSAGRQELRLRAKRVLATELGRLLQGIRDRDPFISVRNRYIGSYSLPLAIPIKREEIVVKKRKLTLSEIALIASTRGMLGTGIGLLLSGKLSKDQRRAVGWTLVAVGAITTIPLAIKVFGQKGKTRATTLRAA
jgi:hypothetical protein